MTVTVVRSKAVCKILTHGLQNIKAFPEQHYVLLYSLETEMKTVKSETAVNSHSTRHMATFSFSDSEKELFWPTEHVCNDMCVYVRVQGYLPLLQTRLLSNSECLLHSPIQNISECKHTPIISVYAAFRQFLQNACS
jgi:hypothetical protein